MPDEELEPIVLKELEAAFLQVCGQVSDREVTMPFSKSEAKQRLAGFCNALKSRCKDDGFLAPDLDSVSDQVLTFLNCDVGKVKDLVEVIDGLTDYAERPLEEQTAGSIVLFLVTPGSLGAKLLARARVVANARQDEAETEAKVEALIIAARDFSGPCCTKTLDEATNILNRINDLRKDGKKKTYPQKFGDMLGEAENNLWMKCTEIVVPHAINELSGCIAEFVQAANNKGVVSYTVPGDEPGETGDQQTAPVSVLINMEDAVEKLALDKSVKHPLWPLAGSSKAEPLWPLARSSKAAEAAASVVERAVEQGAVVLGIAERVLAKCNPDLGAVKLSTASREQMREGALGGMEGLLAWGMDPELHGQFKTALIDPFLDDLRAASDSALANVKQLVVACLKGDTMAINKVQIKFVCSGMEDPAAAQTGRALVHVLNVGGSDWAGQQPGGALCAYLVFGLLWFGWVSSCAWFLDEKGWLWGVWAPARGRGRGHGL